MLSLFCKKTAIILMNCVMYQNECNGKNIQKKPQRIQYNPNRNEKNV